MSDFEVNVAAFKEEEGAVLVSKHADYGPDNINNTPGGPLNGIVVRLFDKVSRLSHLLGTDGSPNFEGVEDTLLDIANYGTIGQMVLAGVWPRVGTPGRWNGTASSEPFREWQGSTTTTDQS